MTNANGKSVKRKHTVLRTRKSIGMGKESGSDDDFKPIKPARKPTKKAAPDARKKAPVLSSDLDSDVEVIEKAQPKRRAASDEETVEMSQPAKKTKGIGGSAVDAKKKQRKRR